MFPRLVLVVHKRRLGDRRPLLVDHLRDNLVSVDEEISDLLVSTLCSSNQVDLLIADQEQPFAEGVPVEL